MRLKKGDIVVVAVSFCLFIVSLVACVFFKGKGQTVKIYDDNKLVFSGSLFENKTVELPNNTVIIKNGKAYMKESSCKNQICVKTGEISKSRECIVCLPNKVIIEIE